MPRCGPYGDPRPLQSGGRRREGRQCGPGAGRARPPGKGRAAHGGAEGAQLEALLAGSYLELLTVRIAGSIRANVTVVESDGTTTKLNEPGPRLSRDELDALAVTLRQAAAGAGWVALCGSLSPGTPVGWYDGLIRQLRGTGPRVAIDSSGPPLAKAIAARPDLVKPNREELAELTGRPLGTIADVADAAATPRAFPPELVDEAVEVTGTREQRRRLLPARLMVYFVLALWLFRGRNCGYGQVMAKLADGLYHQRRGADLLAGRLDPGGWVDAGAAGGGSSRTSLPCPAGAASSARTRCGCCSSRWRGRPERTARKGSSAAGCGSCPWTGP